MEKKLFDELEKLKDQLLGMGARVEKNIQDAMTSLLSKDEKLAGDVSERDPEIDLVEIEIDEHCLHILALHQPVAGDLRFVTTALKVVKDMERIGDMAKDIAQLTLQIIREEPVTTFSRIPEMSQAAQGMLSRAMDSFVNRDVTLARRVIQDDDTVDELNHEVLAGLIDAISSESIRISLGMQLLSIAKYLERIGDHSSNIAEMVIFMVEGKDVRHAEKIRRLTD